MSVDTDLFLALAGVAGVGIAYIVGHSKGAHTATVTADAEASAQTATDTATAATAALNDSEVRDAVDATVRALPAAAVDEQLQQFTDPASSPGQGLQLDETHSDQPAGPSDGEHQAPDSGVQPDAAADLQPVTQALKMEIPMSLKDAVAKAEVIVDDVKKFLPLLAAGVALIDELAPSLNLEAKVDKLKSIAEPVLATGIVSDGEKVLDVLLGLVNSSSASTTESAQAVAEPAAA